MAVSPLCKKILVVGFGAFLLLGGAIIGFFWPKICDSIKASQLVLSPDSKNYEMWKETPLPMFLEFYMFNWTNPKQVKLGLEKPHFVEVGPYTFMEKHTQVNLQWHEHNDTVTFQQVREWHFVESKSVGSLNDTITNLNVIATFISHAVKSFSTIKKWGVDYFLEGKESLSVTKPVGEWIFEGYDDPLLDMAMELKKLIPKLNIPFDKFGWYYKRNMSASFGGTFNIGTGEKDLNDLGLIQLWNNASSTPFYPGQCGRVKGTTGELYPPLYDEESVNIFVSDLCSLLILNKTDPMEKHGIKGYRYVAKIDQFDNGTAHPEFSCFTAAGSALPRGVRNMSSCRDNAPAFVSFPHFYQADSFYLENVDGMQPDPKHEFFIAIEPLTGIPLEVEAQVQVNIWLEPVEGLKMFEKVPRVMMPMFWIRQKTELSADLAGQVKILLMLSPVGQYTLFGLAGVGVVLLLVAIIVTARRGWGDEDDERLMLCTSTSTSTADVRRSS